MNIKDEIVLDIDSISLSGEGIARREGLVYFVDGALPGEQVKSVVIKIEKNLVRSKTIEVLKKSPERIQPVCPHFGACGGCSFQHLKYEKQLEIKRHELEQMFTHLGKFTGIHVEPVIPSPHPYHYRNTVALSIRTQQGYPYFGFIGKDNRTFIPIENCPIAEEKINSLIPHVREQFQKHIPEDKKYKTSQVVLRIGTDHQFHTSIKKDPESSKILTAVIDGKKFNYHGSSFFQTNFSVTEKMVGVVKEFLNAENSRPRSLLDLYCGAGLFAICFANQYESVMGIEESEDAIQIAKQNAALNQISNVHFLAGRTEEILKKCVSTKDEPLHVVIDPPRIGMKPHAIQTILEIPNVEKLVYVSCHPATLIRDLQLLGSRFKIEKVQPLDMFPQTQHLEIVVSLAPRTN